MSYLSDWYMPYEPLKRMRRNWKILVISLFFSALILWNVLGIYMLFYPSGVILKLTDNPPGFYPIPNLNPENIELDGAALFLGDLHLTYGEDSSRFSDLPKFISRNAVRNIIFVGDLFDTPHDAEKILDARNGIDAVHAIFNHLQLSDETVKLYFVKGFQAHDPKEFDLNVQQDGITFRTMGKSARFSNNDTRVITIHGDDAFGGLHGFIFSYITGRPYLEAWWKDMVNLNDEEWVIMGHSHSPNINYSRRVANTGGWTDIFGFGPPTGRGILLVNEEVTLVNISDQLP